MTNKKIINLISDYDYNHSKGIVTNQVVRFISTGSDPLTIFLRAYSKRGDDDLSSNFFKNYHFIVFDKDSRCLSFFREFLAWDAELYPNENSQGLLKFLSDLSSKLEIEINQLDLSKLQSFLYKTGFSDRKRFLDCWNHFINCKFEYINLDIIKQNKMFIEYLFNLPVLASGDVQFLRLGINKKKYESSIYKHSMNEIFHLLYMQGVKRYKSMAMIPDDTGSFQEKYAGKIYIEMNPTFCILPHMHVQYKPTGQSKLCCRYDSMKENKDFENNHNQCLPSNDLSEMFLEKHTKLNIQKTSIENTFFSDYWDKARSLTTENLPLSGCHKCYKEESGNDQSPMSMRLGSNIIFNHGYLHKNVYYKKPKLEFLELGFGNYCNLACLSCNSSLSTTWYDDEVNLNKIVDDKLKRPIFPRLENLSFTPDDSTLETLKVIKFTGGEPMINPEFIKFIDYICEKGDPSRIELEIYTNCSYIPSEKLIKNLSLFKEIHLNLSIDSFGIANDYIRYGSTWEGSSKQTVIKSLDFWLDKALKQKNIKLIMATTLSVLNIFDMPKMIEWWTKYYNDSGNEMYFESSDSLLESHRGFFKFQVAFDPSYISVSNLPKEYYSDISEWMDRYKENFHSVFPHLDTIPDCIVISFRKLESLINRSKGDKNQISMLKSYLESMDSVRKNSYKIGLPKLSRKIDEFLSN